MCDLLALTSAQISGQQDQQPPKEADGHGVCEGSPAVHSGSPRLAEPAAGASQPHQFLETACLRLQHFDPQLRQPVVSAAWVLVIDVGVILRLLEQPRVAELGERAIQGRGPEADLSFGSALDLLANRIAVPVRRPA